MKETEEAEKIARQATRMVFDFLIDTGIIKMDEIESITIAEITKRMDKIAGDAGHKSPEERGKFWSGLFDQRNRNKKAQ